MTAARIVRPSTSAGWAPPWTDTPDEIEHRRQAAADTAQDLRDQATGNDAGANGKRACSILTLPRDLSLH